MITHHTQLLQALIDKHGLKSYLEIGVQNPANNFDKIMCFSKQGVDPCFVNKEKGEKIIPVTSDKFFVEWVPLNNDKYDLIFIDGDHTAEQVKRDFENSLRCLTDNGFIVIHDCLPVEESTTLVPRQTRCWHGTVYKFCLGIGDYPDIGYKTFNIDEGCMLIWKQSGAKNDSGKNLSIKYDWNLYSTMGKWLLKVVDEVII